MAAEHCANRIRAVVAMDVGNAQKMIKGVKKWLFVTTYQSSIMSALKLKSNSAAKKMAKIFGAPDVGDVRYRMGYLYAMFWQDYILGSVGKDFNRSFTKQRIPR